MVAMQLFLTWSRNHLSPDTRRQLDLGACEEDSGSHPCVPSNADIGGHGCFLLRHAEMGAVSYPVHVVYTIYDNTHAQC